VLPLDHYQDAASPQACVSTCSSLASPSAKGSPIP
jgi:hypothetical protein